VAVPITAITAEIVSHPITPVLPRREPLRRYPDINHAGKSLPEDADFFAPRPEEIGAVWSGDTTLRKHQRPWPRWAVTTSISIGAVLGLLAGIVGFLSFGADWWLWKACWVVVGLLVGLFVGMGVSSFMHRLTYVGEQGIATISCMNARDQVDSSKLFLFKDADDLWTVITNHYKLGVRVRTTWSYAWHTREGKSVKRWSGTYFDKEPKSSEDYYLARATAAAWADFQQARLAEPLNRGERVRFVMKRPGDWIDLALGSITFCQGAPPVTWTKDEIDTVEAGKEDAVVFKHHRRSEGLLSSEGVQTIKAHELANAEVFFRVLPRTIGFSVNLK
jgi:hypothetical protein